MKKKGNNLNQIPVQPMMYGTPVTPLGSHVQPVSRVVNDNPFKDATKVGDILISILVIIILIVGIGGYFINPKDINLKSLFTKKDPCIENFEAEGYLTYNNQMAVEYKESQYVFDTRFNIKLVQKAIEFAEDVQLKVCYGSPKKKYDFTVGDAKNTKEVRSFELYNKQSGKQINASTVAELLKGIGYHPYGKHTEEVTVVDFYLYATYTQYKIYTMTVKFKSGREVKANYFCYNNDQEKMNTLEKGKKYKIEFQTSEESFEPIVYKINDIRFS